VLDFFFSRARGIASVYTRVPAADSDDSYDALAVTALRVTRAADSV
jgi:hypothetical protein